MGLLSCYIGCNQSGSPVELVVPSGFSGPIWIIEDAENGNSIPKDEGRYRVVVPPSGKLRVSSLEPFMKWHSISAHFADGLVLALDGGTTEPPDDAVALRGGGCVTSIAGGHRVNYIPHYVGTKQEAKVFLETPRIPDG